MKTQTAPDLYLSTSENAWRVIYQGMPLCADTDEQTAIKVYDKTLTQLRRKPESNIPVWDGNICQFR